MSVFQYQYLDNRGKKRSGAIEASDEKDAKDKLRSQGIFVTRIGTKSRTSSRQNLKGEVLTNFTMQLSQLVNAGLPLYESLSTIEEQSKHDPHHRIILSLCEQIRMGVPLSSAMMMYPESFDRLYCGMVAAGEAVGSLGAVLEKLTFFLTRQMRLKKQIQTAMIYPMILGGFSFLIIALLLGFVVPSLEGIFVDRPLNAFTKMILLLSNFFRFYWWIYIPTGVGVIFWTYWICRSSKGKLLIERVLMKLPILKTLMIQTAVARFCRTLASLLQGGLGMIEALKISRGVIKNQAIEKEIQIAEQRIIEGRSLSQELLRSAFIPPMVARMVAVGEESGTSTAMLGRVADIYETELEKSLDRVMALAQPVILMIMGVVIGAVLLAILLPLTDISSFTGN